MGHQEFWRWNMEQMTDRTLDDDEIARWARFTRLCASPQAISAILDSERQVDVRPLLSQIRLPTLVMRSRGDAERGEEGAAPWVAEQIPGARYVELPSGDHYPLEPEAYLEFERFLSGVREHDAVFDRVLATVLFTDIVDSTAQVGALGDRAGGEVRDTHDQVVRAHLARYRGREVKTMGDGSSRRSTVPLAQYVAPRPSSPASTALGVDVRAGLHTGEVELDGDDVSGIAVAIGARVGAVAEPSEVLVSQTIKDLTAGSGIVFADAWRARAEGRPRSLAPLPRHRLAGQRRTSRSSQLLLGSGFAALSAWRTARRRRCFPRRNSSSVRLRIVVSARRKVSTSPRKSARLAGYVSRTCSRACRRNPAASNAAHVSLREGKVSIARAVSGNHRAISIPSSFRVPAGSYLSG